ncbi:endonuclease/exonuclease/phosphatase family protein [Flavobacterium sp. JP2137]|uniref:endonuclease/exonuclease/phosphatase family protein n=1 Tax=Flavobacterium sp. JP2137 TaxID=3414510 RepID=UPI003D2FE14D
MKRLSWFNKTVFFLNIILAILTLLGYFLPFLAPKLFPFLSVLTLILPMLLIANIFFLVYWGLQFKRQLLLSAVILLLGTTFINKFYKFSGRETPLHEDDFVVMSYNVRLFNLFNWIKDADVAAKIKEFVDHEDPDVLCLQEYSKNAKLKFPQYKFKYTTKHGQNIQTGQAIFSKYRMIDKGEIHFPNSNNNVIYADIVKGKDTLRVYSMHLQSVNISPDIHEKIDEKKSKLIFNRLSVAFKEQQLQSELIQSHMDDSKHPKIICGDMNNSAFSYVYRNIRGDLQDAFVEAGYGFGKSYHFVYYPARIDYVFVDNRIEVKAFKTYDDFINSDHYPIAARLKMVEKSDEITAD